MLSFRFLSSYKLLRGFSWKNDTGVIWVPYSINTTDPVVISNFEPNSTISSRYSIGSTDVDSRRWGLITTND